MQVTARRLKSACVRWFNAISSIGVAFASRRMARELARREAKRGQGEFQWFTPEEAVVAEALARIIVPSDDETPGIDEVGVLDAPALVTLDGLVKNCIHRRDLYSRGLLSFDVWTLKERGCRFSALGKKDQVALFRAAQQFHEECFGALSASKKAWRRFRAMAGVNKGTYFAAQLYPQIREDCLRVFYTSRVSWTWLEYDGPPMEKGYTSLVTPRDR